MVGMQPLATLWSTQETDFHGSHHFLQHQTTRLAIETDKTLKHIEKTWNIKTNRVKTR
jgi:hypothetical protein